MKISANTYALGGKLALNNSGEKKHLATPVKKSEAKGSEKERPIKPSVFAEIKGMQKDLGKLEVANTAMKTMIKDISFYKDLNAKAGGEKALMMKYTDLKTELDKTLSLSTIDGISVFGKGGVKTPDISLIKQDSKDANRIDADHFIKTLTKSIAKNDKEIKHMAKRLENKLDAYGENMQAGHKNSYRFDTDFSKLDTSLLKNYGNAFDASKLDASRVHALLD